jgi:hypothetical protein
MNIRSFSESFSGIAGFCLDRLLKQRSALRKPNLSFSLPPQRGGLRNSSGLARMPWTLGQQLHASDRLWRSGGLICTNIGSFRQGARRFLWRARLLPSRKPTARREARPPLFVAAMPRCEPSGPGPKNS